jgi:radical SAM protein with 4Fe4S-binding SPASM domain
MTNNQLSLVLLPTNKCNVACEYCFEDKTADFHHSRASLAHCREAVGPHGTPTHSRADHLLAGWGSDDHARVTSYPEYRFGNVFGAKSFSQLMKESKARRRFVSRPEAMIEHETCASCDYLSICHGGCPVRAYSITGEFFTKDPYCEVYQALFSRMESIAAQLSRARFARSLPVLPIRGGVVNRGNSL